MIGTYSRCKQKEQEVRRIESYQLCKKCFGRANKIVKDKYAKVW
jgi:Zn finger protein HypA/HybF involved in hydrogenase expression